MLKDSLEAICGRPKRYEEMEIPFWDDEHISKQMLAAHLAPDFEGASRKLDFIRQSVGWIGQAAPAADYPELLDIGCGPGIYAELFARAGYRVTGMDLSRRSVQYAAESAGKQGLDIAYQIQNYLDLDVRETYDLCTLIYCDYGVLPPEKREILMGNVFRCLKKGGRFLLDVFSMKTYREFEERRDWESCPDGGFWSAEGYAALNRTLRYPPNVTLEQVAVLSEHRSACYYLWNTCFTAGGLVLEAERAGFKAAGLYGDVAGRAYTDDSPTIAVLLEK